MRTRLVSAISLAVVALVAAPSAAHAVAYFPMGHADTALAADAYDAPFLLLWAAGGALVLALVLTVSIRMARRNAAVPARPSGRPAGRHRA